MGKGYSVRRLSDVEGIECLCGTSVRLFTNKDNTCANVHVVHIKDSEKHYHNECTEFYYILEGRGTLEVGNDTVELQPGTCVQIDTGTPHRGRGDFRALIIGVPPLKEDDQVVVEE
jgi:mannose-6-phosphate isomerase-like protein (cupin superfamily)